MPAVNVKPYTRTETLATILKHNKSKERSMCQLNGAKTPESTLCFLSAGGDAERKMYFHYYDVVVLNVRMFATVLIKMINHVPLVGPANTLDRAKFI